MWLQLFSALFKVAISAHGDSARQGLVSLIRKKRCFALFSDSVMGFKDKLFYVVVVSMPSYLRMRHVNSEGTKVLKFHFSWS